MNIQRYLINTAIIYFITLTFVVNLMLKKEWFYPRAGQESCAALLERDAQAAAVGPGAANISETPIDSLLINYFRNNPDLHIWILVFSCVAAATSISRKQSR